MMRRTMRWSSWLVQSSLLLSLTTGCGESETARPPHVARTGGSAVALSFDERVAVITNRSVGSVTVLWLKPERGLKDMVAHSTQVSLGEGSEPWAAVIGADDDTAYVLLRRSQQVVRIDNLRHEPTPFQQRISTGSEPMSLALSPTGKQLFVANSEDGTLNMIDTEAFALRSVIDLNQDLLELGMLGEVKARAGLAHPRALAISDDGDQDDEDETLFATEFFSQPVRGASKDLSEVDRNREGVIYARRLETGQADRTIELSPIADTGFADSSGEPTSCFPNQLYAAAVDGDTLYVTSMCTSPKGPLDRPQDDPSNVANFKTLAHPAVFAVDVNSHEEIPERTWTLTHVLDDLYRADGAYAADGSGPQVRMPLIPNDISFGVGHDGKSSALITALGADAVFRLDYSADGSLSIGDEQHRFASLPESGYAVGVAASRRSEPAFSLAYSEVAQQATIVDASGDRVTSFPTTPGDPIAAAVKASDANAGKGVFASGLGVWSLFGQAWSSCESCHPGGGSDGVVWYFARGPRRTPAPFNTYEKLADDAKSSPTQRLMLWGANIDEVHDIEVIVRTVSGGSGALVWDYLPHGESSSACRIVYDGRALPTTTSSLCRAAKPSSILRNGLNSSLAIMVGSAGCAPDQATCDATPRQDWNKIDAFIRTLRRPSKPTTLDPDRIAAGRQVFKDMGCAGCHAGPLFTLSTRFYTPSDAENGAAPAPIDGRAPGALPNASAALGRLRQAKYEVPLSLAFLNPPSLRTGPCSASTYCSTFRTPPAGPSPQDAWDLLYGPSVDQAAKNAGNDALLCALRDVGTFPIQGPGPVFGGRAPADQPAPLEVRQDGKTLALGQDGFGIPSLFGLATGGPYFHAGNARTLEEVFDDAFELHVSRGLNGTGASEAMGDEQRRNLVEFLLSIDASTEPFEATAQYDFCRGK